MSSFDEFWGEFAIGLNADENEAQSIWEAGAQSRQSEVDELKERIDGAVLALENRAIGLGGVVSNYNKALDILKGNQS